ncbi:MAG: oxidoreductase [Verrucomicrobia bacterium]|nr:oxidoreductase [Verrucomicrobiota bacterium]
MNPWAYRQRPIAEPAALLLLILAVGAALSRELQAAVAQPLSLLTFEPGHFHAALFQREMLPGVSERVHVYAPLGPDLLAHLGRIAQFNTRKDNPTRWQLEVHTGPDFLERLLAERPGNVVVLSGNNRGKIDRIEAIVRAGLHVLADKPWIIELADLPKLQAALDTAEQQGVVAFDAMTQRFEITCILQRELVNDRDLFGTCLEGSVSEPAVHLESVHYLLKEVAGAPMRRPAWFFDIGQQGEGLTDVGTHLVDLVQWTLFPKQAIEYGADLHVLRGERWPTVLAREQFQRVTGERDLPDFLDDWRSGRQAARSPKSEVSPSRSALRAGGRNLSEPERSPSRRPKSELKQSRLTPVATANDCLEYFCNNTVLYTLRGIHVRLDIKWDFEAPPDAKDTELAVFRGSKSRIEVRQEKENDFRPEVYVVPDRAEQRTEVHAALRKRIEALQKSYPGLSLEEQPGRLRVVIPDRYRVGHEAHFALLSRLFLQYVREPKSVPAWEKPNMLAKYYVTTKGVELARRRPSSQPARPTASQP